jgi:AcrR family transcriptional regulator
VSVPTSQPAQRARLNRARVLVGAVDLADRIGLEALSMRTLAQELGVAPMALYKHVAHKDELIDGMVDVVIGEIAAPEPGAPWREALRGRVLDARRVLLAHPWARRALETRTTQSPAALDYIDTTIAVFRAAGFSDDLTHHVMHAFGSRMWGFTQELFDDPGASAPSAEPPPPEVLQAMAQRYPNVLAIATTARHRSESVVGYGCDDQFEFEFALDLMLDGFARLHEQRWTSLPSA